MKSQNLNAESDEMFDVKLDILQQPRTCLKSLSLLYIFFTEPSASFRNSQFEKEAIFSRSPNKINFGANGCK